MNSTSNKPEKQSKRFALPLDPPDPVVIIDSREQNPVDVSPLKSMRGTLDAGDYSILGIENGIAVERKSLSDLLSCIGGERERFERCVMRLLGYPVRAIVCECSWQDLEKGEWRSQVTPQAAIGSCLGWIVAGVPIIMAGDHERAGRYIARLLWIAARRRWRELRALAGPAGAPE